jgi:hypothetical protein
MSSMSWMPSIPPIYVLCNPQYEVARYNFLLGHFEKRGIPMNRVKFIHGPWGSELKPADILPFWQPFKERFGNKTALSFKADNLSKGELSLLLGFRRLIEQALADGSDTILVFESDIVLREDFLIRLETVLKGVTEGEWADWDYVSLGEGVGTRPKGCEWRSYFAEVALYRPDHQFVFRCCDSMLLRRKFLEKLAVTFGPVRECLDWELNLQMMVHRGKSVWVDPPLCEPASGRNRTVTSLPS